MTDPIQLISTLPPHFADDCLRFARFTFAWGGWFIILAFIAAIVQTAGAVLSLFPKKKKDNTESGEVSSTTAFLEALKGVLIALASLPAWLAIFLAGLALLWMSSETPKRCAALEAPKREAPQSPADAQRNPQQPATNPSAH